MEEKDLSLWQSRNQVGEHVFKYLFFVDNNTILCIEQQISIESL